MRNELVLIVHHDQSSSCGHCCELGRGDQLFLNNLAAGINLFLTAALRPFVKGLPAVGGETDRDADTGIDDFGLALAVNIDQLRASALKHQHQAYVAAS